MFDYFGGTQLFHFFGVRLVVDDPVKPPHGPSVPGRAVRVGAGATSATDQQARRPTDGVRRWFNGDVL